MSISYISVIKKTTDRNIYSQFYHPIGYLINELKTCLTHIHSTYI